MIAHTAKRKLLPREVIWLSTVPELLVKPFSYIALLGIFTEAAQESAEGD